MNFWNKRKAQNIGKIESKMGLRPKTEQQIKLKNKKRKNRYYYLIKLIIIILNLLGRFQFFFFNKKIHLNLN